MSDRNLPKHGDEPGGNWSRTRSVSSGSHAEWWIEGFTDGADAANTEQDHHARVT